jgi:hypothetical protein
MKVIGLMPLKKGSFKLSAPDRSPRTGGFAPADSRRARPRSPAVFEQRPDARPSKIVVWRVARVENQPKQSEA